MSNENQALQSVDQKEMEVLSSNALLQRRRTIQNVMREVMQENIHFGIIPGTKNPTLLKPGAEVLCSTFMFAPRYHVERFDLSGGHREYEVRTLLYYTPSQQMLGEGVGTCSSMEKKYRYRNKEENPDISDTFNSILKMAKKRSLVDAILTALAASDMFSVPEEESEEHDERRESSQSQFVTQQQIGTLMSACTAYGVTEDRLKGYLADTYKIESRKDIPLGKLGDILAWVKSQRK